MLGQGDHGGVPSAGSVDAAPGVGGGTGQEQPRDGCLRAAQAPRGAEHQLLVQAGRPAVERAPAEVRVVGLQRGRGLDVARQHARAEARRHPLHLLLHPLDLAGHDLGVAGALAR